MLLSRWIDFWWFEICFELWKLGPLLSNFLFKSFNFAAAVLRLESVENWELGIKQGVLVLESKEDKKKAKIGIKLILKCWESRIRMILIAEMTIYL